MATYKIFDFLLTGDISTAHNYPAEVYQEYLGHFDLIPFTLDDTIKSLHFDLTIPSTSRVCNGYAYDMSYDEILASGNERFPRPVAFLTLTLWRTGNPEIIIRKNPLH
jgi:hypothetical protein